jgi:transposase
LAKEGKSSTEIATVLGISKSSVDHSDGWKNRKEDTFVF